MVSEHRSGERFLDLAARGDLAGDSPPQWEDEQPDRPHVWRTLGYRRVRTAPGFVALAWDATEPYGFPAGEHTVIHGGLVTTLLDSAMGGAAFTVLDRHEVFLTADLRVEFLRPAMPGELTAEGRVVRRARRVVFCAADLHDGAGRLLATSRCTQIVLPADDGRA
jgi:uncharacterized protein (TIGR00369 family)